jgi:hypothetical protein
MDNTVNIEAGNNVFQRIRERKSYCVDKSLFIKEFFKSKGRASLITRPRGFGKSLNLSMLKAYLEIGADLELFKGLEIESETGIRDAHFGKHPVLHISLAGVSGESFVECANSLAQSVCAVCQDLKTLPDYDRLSPDSKNDIERLISPPVSPDLAHLKSGLSILTRAVSSYYGKEVVVLIDEYDAAIIQSISKGYGNRLLDFLSGFYSCVLKGNERVEFVALTGCLRIAGIADNLVVSTVSDPEYASRFGLTEEEVTKVLADIGFSGALPSIREWHGGFLFGGKRIYNASSVMSYCKDLQGNPKAHPKSHWANSSSDDILQDVIAKAESEDLPDLEKFILGEPVKLAMKSEIAFGDFDDISSLWSVLVHLEHIPKFRNGTGKILANASTTDFSGARI